MEQQIVIPFIVPLYCSVVLAVFFMASHLPSFKVVIILDGVYIVYRALTLDYQSVNMSENPYSGKSSSRTL